MSVQQSAPGWVRVGMDVVSLLFAWAIVFKQAGIVFPPPDQISEPLLWLAGAMIGVPGVSQILSFRFGGGTGIGGQRSVSPVPVSPAGPSSSVPSGGE